MGRTHHKVTDFCWRLLWGTALIVLWKLEEKDWRVLISEEKDLEVSM
jgi:hypothetical protein